MIDIDSIAIDERDVAGLSKRDRAMTARALLHARSQAARELFRPSCGATRRSAEVTVQGRLRFLARYYSDNRATHRRGTKLRSAASSHSPGMDGRPGSTDRNPGATSLFGFRREGDGLTTRFDVVS